MNLDLDKAEFSITQTLLADFSSDKALTPEEAVKLCWSNYSKIENEFSSPNPELYSYFSIPDYWYKLIQFIHFQIFKGVYTNAGSFRKISDSNNGKVYFGPQLAHMQKPRFEGFSPTKIEKSIFEICEELSKHTLFELKPILTFYQQFVRIHPFYDGNGRVARILTNHWLSKNNKALSWSNFDDEKKFIKKLNLAHHTSDIDLLEKYCTHFLIDIST